MDDAELATLLKEAFLPFARGFATLAPERVECSVDCQPGVAAACTLRYAADDRAAMRGRPVETALESALRALCLWVDGRDAVLSIQAHAPGGTG
jgi:hypothetical protein